MSIDQTVQKRQMTDSICDCLSRMWDIIYMSSPRIDEELPGVACLAVAKQLEHVLNIARDVEIQAM